VAGLDKTVVLLQICGEGERGTQERATARIAGDTRGNHGNMREKELKGLETDTCWREDVELARWLYRKNYLR
jgi:hypothetical protein